MPIADMPISDMRTMKQAMAGSLGYIVFRLSAVGPSRWGCSLFCCRSSACSA